MANGNFYSTDTCLRVVALVAIVLVLAGVISYINFRSIAKTRAEKTAKIVAEKIAREMTGQYIVTNLDAIIREYLNAMPAVGSGASGDVGDRIAEEESAE